MKVKKVEENIKITKLNEGGLSRIWKHTQDSSTFAIIGSQDKDTKEDRSEELIYLLSNLRNKSADKKIGYKFLFGRYEYDDGTIGNEVSAMIFNITKDQALSIMRKLNQESIIWKDENFFGFLDASGNEDGVLSSSERNMNFSDEDIKLFGSRLAKHKNKNQMKWYKFVMEHYKPTNESHSSIRNMAKKGTREKEVLFECVNYSK